jgi:hypothetical protein
VVKSAHNAKGSVQSVPSSAEETESKVSTQSRAHLAVDDSSIDERNERKTQSKDKKSKTKQSAVASHTGKYANDATFRAMIAAACGADRDADEQGVTDHSDVVTFGVSGSQRTKLRKKREQIGKKRRRER